jgi:hypothetical protein
LYIDRHGFIWATDIQKHQVRKFRPDGTLVMTLGTYGVRGGHTPDTFNQPTHVVVVALNDDIFVSDGYGGPTVTTCAASSSIKDGKFLKAWSAGDIYSIPPRSRADSSVTRAAADE